MALIPAAPQQESAKEKTKAKQRYLKQKKQRRKNRKSTGAPKSAQDPAAEDPSDDEAIDVDDGTLSEPPVAEPVIESAAKPPKRPKKRRKILDEEGAAEGDAEEAADVEMDDVLVVSEVADVPPPAAPPPPDSPTLRAALPSFPLPTLPNAPSKSLLALQGLDRALIDAELVDPATLLPIPEAGEDDTTTGLSDKTRRRLKELGITELFAVQTSLLPFLLPPNPKQRALYLPYAPPRDVCVSAPTGSGKTLAYVLPIIETLASRIVTRLRALIVLPTRDLVTQVRETFEAVGKGQGLKIGTATGQHSFAHEQNQLVGDKSSHLLGGSSKVDILICTPGRLMDHLNETPNFSLQHLRFLVIDEADRLLAQSFQDWLIQVLAATRPPARSNVDAQSPDPAMSSIPYPDAVAPAFHHLLPFPSIPTFMTEQKESSCQKLLFSATLTRDPGKIAALELRDPKYFIVQGGKERKPGDEDDDVVMDVATEKFSMPATLTEHMIVCESSQKPLMLFHLVHAHGVANALVFTKSADSTTRLVRLFDFFETARSAGTSNVTPIVIRAYSSDLPPAERKSILEKFRAQEIHILVCSDLISRGIDISHVAHVVSYDAPVDILKYVHRVGRTARAGRAGDAWTLVEEQEARYFKSMLKAADHLEKVKRLRVNEAEVAPLVPAYDIALGQLKEVYVR